MLVIRILISLLFLCNPALSQAIAVTGRVVEQSGAGIQNAEVSFPKYSLSVFTDADGSFSLTGTADIFSGPGIKFFERPAIQAGEILFRHPGGEEAGINVYTVQGEQIGQWKSGVSPGNYRVPVNTVAKTSYSGIYLIKITNGKKIYWLHHYSLSNNPASAKISFERSSDNILPLSKKAAVDTLKVTATGYVSKTVTITSLVTADLIITLDKLSGSVSISIDKNMAPAVFAASKIGDALQKKGQALQVVDNSAASGQENIQLKMINSNEDAEIKKEGFRIRKSGGAYVVTAKDKSGAMYGLLEIAEQIQMKNGLAGITEKVENPRFPFRAIKFNLPWSSYRRNEALQINEDICKDIKLWESFLDMMAENRFSALTLWNLHPWPYMVIPTNFPKAAQGNAREMADWKLFYTTLFKMAKDRAIETYVVNWNIFVSKGFHDNYSSTGKIDDGDQIGPANDTEIVRRYNRECITQVINEYPDLTGLGVTLGERMQNLSSNEQTDYVKKVFFQGIKNADREIKFIYRAALKGDHNVHRATIDGSGLDTPENPIIVELKFNWSHAYSTTTLVKAHGGGTGSEYWTNPAPTHHKMAWMVRNEDFFRLRWGEPGFIRKHIQVNGQDYVCGYFVGSETYIPGKDIFHKPGHPHVSWSYAFERQWLFYKQWGRLLYNENTPDAVFVNAFNQRFPGNTGDKMVEAYKLATRTTQRIAGFFNFTWDYTFYTEGFRGKGGFISLSDVRNSDPIEPDFVSVNEYGNGNGNFGGRITPVKLASDLENDCTQALALVNGISTSDNTLKCEIEDVKAWSHLGLYFAKKVRTAVAQEQNKNSQASGYIKEARQHWRDLVTVTDAHIQESYLPHQNTSYFHWKKHQKQVDNEVF